MLTGDPFTKVLTDCDMLLVAAAVSLVNSARINFNLVIRSGRIERTVVKVYKKRRPKCEFHSRTLSQTIGQMVLLYSFHLRKAVPLYLPMPINIHYESARQWHVYQCISFHTKCYKSSETDIFKAHSTLYFHGQNEAQLC